MVRAILAAEKGTSAHVKEAFRVVTKLWLCYARLGSSMAGWPGVRVGIE